MFATDDWFAVAENLLKVSSHWFIPLKIGQLFRFLHVLKPETE